MGDALAADPEDLTVNSQILCEAHQGNACLQTQGSHDRRGVETGDSQGTLRTVDVLSYKGETLSQPERKMRTG